MKRVLIASTVLLAAALAFLVFQRLTARPPAPAPPPPDAAATAGAQTAEPAKVPEPAHAEPAHAEPAHAEPAHAEPAHAEPAHAEPAKAPEPAKAAQASPAPADHAMADRTAGAPPGPKHQKRPAERAQPDAATAAAIFGDRAPSDGEGGKPKSPRIPVLRKPGAGVAPAGYLSAAAASAPPPGASRAAAPGHAPTRARGSGVPVATSRAAAAPGAPRPAEPVQHLPGAISGTLRSAAGSPLAGAPILALSAAGDDAFETVTDDDGFYLLAAMQAGRYLLFAGIGASGAPPLPARAVEVKDGRVLNVDLREPAGGATVRIRPLRADGRPAPGQVVLVAGPVASTASLAALLSSDAIYLPEAGSQNVLRHVPPGVYTPVILQAADRPPQVSRQPVAVRSDAEQVLEVRLPVEAGAPG